MRTYPITPKEVGRKGDIVVVDGKEHRVRERDHRLSSELVEVDLGDIVQRADIESASRPYQPGDWRAA